MTTPSQSDTSFEEINRLIWDHLKARDWHTADPRGIAVSISLEANELLEHYQWSDIPIGSKEELAAELADVIIYAFQFAQQTGIDIADAVTKKLAKAAEKYPAAQFKGKAREDMRDSWIAAKKNYRKEEIL